jgi:hypothetical protein
VRHVLFCNVVARERYSSMSFCSKVKFWLYYTHVIHWIIALFTYRHGWIINVKVPLGGASETCCWISQEACLVFCKCFSWRTIVVSCWCIFHFLLRSIVFSYFYRVTIKAIFGDSFKFVHWQVSLWFLSNKSLAARTFFGGGVGFTCCSAILGKIHKFSLWLFFCLLLW